MANQTMNQETMYQELLKRYNGLRNQHLELLEEKREFLLRSQEDQLLSSDVDRPSRPTSLNVQSFVADELAEGCHEKPIKDEIKGNTTDSELVGSCKCKSAEYLAEIIGVNHKWQEKYDQLLSKHHQLNVKTIKLSNELELERKENIQLRRLVNNLSSDLKNHCTTSSVVKDGTENRKHYNADEIEALKLQLAAYQEDFEDERKDKIKKENEKQLLKETLYETEKKVQSLTDERRRYKQYFEEISQQKDHLVSELRRLSTSSLPFSPVRQAPRSNFLPCSAEDIIPRSSGSPKALNLIRASPTAFMGAKAYEG